MTTKQLADRAKEIIHEITYATVATTSPEGKPWNSPVYCAYDADFNMYWGSHANAQHSKNIRSNGHVFLVIYNSTVPAGEGEGVYIDAICKELNDTEEIAFAHNLLQNRRPVPYWQLDEVGTDKPVHLYKATPQRIWMNDEGESAGQYIDIRTEITL